MPALRRCVSTPRLLLFPFGLRSITADCDGRNARRNKCCRGGSLSFGFRFVQLSFDDAGLMVAAMKTTAAQPASAPSRVDNKVLV